MSLVSSMTRTVPRLFSWDGVSIVHLLRAIQKERSEIRSASQYITLKSNSDKISVRCSIMRLSVPANFDPDLVPQLALFPVEDVYGKLPWDVVGGGRPSYMGTPITERSLSTYVGRLAHHGIDFNYLLNASCLGNREFSRSWQKKTTRLLERLEEMGVHRLTVSTPFLLELVKRRFPSFKVKVGIYAQVDSPRRARFWSDLGADAITLESFSINRHFDRLAAIRNSVSCDLQLIANHVCLPNCALQPYHQNGFAHASDGSDGLFIDYCILRCARIRCQDPSNFIKAQWIRPEDLGRYEKMGFDSFKLLERGIPSVDLLRRVKAYGERKHSGNLADLLLSYGFREEPAKPRFWALRHFFKPFQASPFKSRALLDLARHQGMLFAKETNPVTIEASKIPEDFLSGFENRDCSASDCRSCRYCEEIASRAVRIDPAFCREALARHSDVDALLVEGGLWNV